MARKTQIHQKIVWDGGLNLALDSGVINDNDLVQADNIVFSTNGARVKREGRDYLDNEIPSVVAVSSSGTTRTLIFDAQVNTASDDTIVAGEKLSISAATLSNYTNTAATVATVTNFGADGGFGPSDVNTGTSAITITAHGYYTGQVGQFTTSGALPTGLSLLSDYYVIVVDANTIKVASTLQSALINSPALLDDGGSGSHTFVPNIKTNNAITYTATGSLTQGATEAIDEITIVRNYSIIGLHDYWYYSSNVKNQRIIAVSSEPKFYQFDINGNRKEITKEAGATALATTPTRVNFLVAQNTLIMAFDGVGNDPKKYDIVNSPLEWEDLANAPDFEVCQLHQGRVFANDKTDPDRLHYSSPFDIETWNGVGDSGAIDLDQGDGDPEGIIAIAKPFKGRMFVSKGRKIIDLLGDSPENYRGQTITEGLGMMSHNSVAPVDVDDLMFVSHRGFHSMAATDAQGDFEGAFLSQKIQPAFNTFTPARLKYTQGTYIPEINSVLFTVSDNSATEHNNIYGYNIVKKEWYRWPDVNAQALTQIQFNARSIRPLIGNDEGRIIVANTGTFEDYDDLPINYVFKSGTIYPNNDPQGLKMFKRLSLYFRPKGDFNFLLKYKIDNLATDELVFTQEAAGDLLGVTFILGDSILGTTNIFAPQTKSIDGIGRGIELTVEATDADQPIEIYGYAIEWEYADINQESL